MARFSARLARGALMAIALEVGLGCALVGPTASGPPGTAVVVRVVDGDTVVLRLGGLEETARLLGVDTPETVAILAPANVGHRRRGRRLSLG